MNFERSILIKATPAHVFALSQDYDRRLHWDPFLRSACLLDGAEQAAVGVKALCAARNGLAMETVYVSFHPPRVAAVRMTSGPWVLALFAGSWRFEELQPGLTRVSFRYALQTRPRWLSFILTPLVGLAFAHDTSKRLAALRQAIEEHGL